MAKHFSAYTQCQRVIGADGKERDAWSFSAWHSNTVIGLTIGKAYIAIRSTIFNFRHPECLTRGKIRTEVRIPAAYTKNSEAGHVFFYNSNLICALEAYIALRQQKRLRVTPNSSTYRGLQPHSQLILSENGTGYSLKRKKRINAEGETVEYSAADTLQSMISSWGKEAGIPNFASHSKCLRVNCYNPQLSCDFHISV